MKPGYLSGETGIEQKTTEQGHALVGALARITAVSLATFFLSLLVSCAARDTRLCDILRGMHLVDNVIGLRSCHATEVSRRYSL